MSKRLETSILKSIFARLGDDKDFGCSDASYDLYVWVELTYKLSDTDIFKHLPVIMARMWESEEQRHILMSQNIKKLSRTQMQAIAANVISLRRQTALPDFEKAKLEKTITFLKQEFDALSQSSFELLQQNEFLRAETIRLSQELDQSKQISLLAPQESRPLLKSDRTITVSFSELTRLSQSLRNDKFIMQN